MGIIVGAIGTLIFVLALRLTASDGGPSTTNGWVKVVLGALPLGFPSRLNAAEPCAAIVSWRSPRRSPARPAWRW